MRVFFQDLKRHIGVEGLQCQCPDLERKSLAFLRENLFLTPNLSSSRSYGQRFNHKP